MENLHWAAVAAGTLAAYGLSMIWFSPLMFGKPWATGSHNIMPPATAPIAAMITMLLGTFALAMIVGLTETTNDLITALVAILAVTLTVAGMDLFSQKTIKATLIDAGYILTSGVVMILAQGLL